MKVNDYVRIKNKAGWCCIGQIHNINEFREPSMKLCVDIQADDYVFVGEDIIEKSSSNIIDLIEVGDYVNGVLIDSIEKDDTGKYVFGYGATLTGETWFYNDEIKSIVTKEQFEGMEYKL